ncbi:MAG: hypothetical protein L6Q54_14110 [Leptospiraceae bacterium]|nr:hypothetical protein [Leptospiraceae bacterium]MCK6382369.1 hypothetical protein [Leptospiraceae bacterium]NUM40709.1 hypothetical protein [Leptospiraceae bacterium]
MFELDSNLNLSAKGMIPDELAKDISFRDWASIVIQKFIELGTYYEKSIGGDGKIIGGEKKEIIDQLCIIFQSILSLRIRTLSEKEFQFMLTHENRGSVSFNFSSYNFWEMTGTLPMNYKIQPTKFSNWINKKLLPQIKELISVYGKALEDGVITPKERGEIYKVIDPLLFEIIIIVIYLERYLVVK